MRLWFIHMSLVLGIFGCGESKGSKTRGTNRSGGDLDGSDRSQEKPQIAFVSPNQDLETDQDIEVQVKFSGNTKRLTWNLYFVPVDSSTKEENVIVEGNDARDTKVTWNTASVSPGTYRLIATFSSPLGQGRFQSRGKLEIKEAGRPTVSITTPEVEKVLLATSPQQIVVKGEDPNGTALTFKIDISSDNGKTWSLVTDSLAKSTYPWNVQKLTQGTQYKLRVTATNPRGLSGTTVMAKPFGIATEPITYATKVATLLASKCGSCHGIGATNAQQFRSDSFDLATIGVSAKADAIKKRTLDGTMPPNGKLTSAELDLVTLWHWSGAQ
jgi:mono/diheme cytochrome c family protein